MQLSGVSKETNDPKGGEIVRNDEGEAIGVFEERAMKVIREAYSDYLAKLSDIEKEEKWYTAIDLAQKECLKKGVTSFQDAGSSFSDVEKYKVMAEEGKLDLRLWAMIRHSSDALKGKLQEVKIVDAGNGYFTCNAIKTEVDGALGSYGAWLLDEYNDKPGFVGQNTTEVDEVRAIAEMAMEHNMQLCVHAIGDRANREVLDICQNIFEKNKGKTDLRWRMEHAQHINVDDIPRFKELGIIASMQAVHCTSDAPFVEKRLGENRARTGAYVWRSLLDAGVVVTNGTDAPVEDVSPIESFYASVTRKRIDNGMEFFPEESMSREEALKSYTLSCAYSAFEENVKGSLEIGKFGDLVILNKDLISCSDEEILDTEVLYTIVGGKIKYQQTID
jgi:predicted amidohydrolase YtcJ